jgi:hypothetical protein
MKTKEEYKQDLKEIEYDIVCMRGVQRCASMLSVRNKVDNKFYRDLHLRVTKDISIGNKIKDTIIKYIKAL